ncbi:hypothetical protein [Vibrio rotiferianus]|uniref:hypothetical protein n=1 Tax=Vibrio rotiferianus TaxID=190895 RepID=UPI000693B2A3|nr:hypothetical protein [Vibrio rotiferianus]
MFSCTKSIFILPLLFMSLQCHASFDGLVKKISKKTNVPVWVISKICVHESQSFHRGKRQAWPWTVNTAGEGSWFRDKQSAVRYANEYMSTGKRNIDIGLCQMNWIYHGHKFKSLEAMFDPQKNMLEAAKYVYKQKGNGTWEEAIGRYHSPNNKKRAQHYASLVLAH